MTPRERAERLIDLTGEIKQANQLVAECERDVTERWRQYETAMGAAQKQRERRQALYEEAKRLGEEAKADFDALVPGAAEKPLSAVVADLREIAKQGDWGPNALEELREIRGSDEDDPPPPEDDFDAAIRTATKAHLGDAYDRATEPQDTGDKTHIFGNGRLP